MKPLTLKERAEKWVEKHGVSFSDDMRRDSQKRAFLAGYKTGEKEHNKTCSKAIAVGAITGAAAACLTSSVNASSTVHDRKKGLEKVTR